MGNVIEKIKETSVERLGSFRSNNKRAREEEPEQTSSSPDNTEILHTPKRKRIKSTSKYIYQKLFLDGKDSDVIIDTLGKDWNLHKLYLCQSGYFNGMFSGDWKESTMSRISISIEDENITEESLKITFGSLYKDDVFIKPIQVVGVLAAATLFQLDGLIQQCILMMSDTLSHSTVSTYYIAAISYNLEDILRMCKDWFYTNLLGSTGVMFTKDIDVEMMVEIISSSKLYVLQVEVDLYSILKKWMFLQCNQSWEGTQTNLTQDMDNFFKKSYQESKKCFLDITEGRRFLPAFKCVRWQHVICYSASLKMLENDHVLPIAWLEPMFLYGWKHVLNVEQGLDKGPETVSDKVFEDSCIRYGRMLSKPGEYCWRWVGYSYGLDLLISIGNRLISLKRNTHTEACPQAVSLQAHRHIIYRMTVATLDENGKTKFTQTSGIKRISLGKDEEETVMLLDKTVEFPLVVSMNLLLISPMSDLPVPALNIPQEIITEETEETDTTQE